MPSTTTQAAPVSEYAIIVSPEDNLAVVKRETAPGLEVELPGGRFVVVRDSVPPGHRFATRDIPAGEFVLQYGQPVGTSLGIRGGERISHANMTDEVPVVRDLPEDLQTPPPVYIPASERATFRGFRRPDGRVGTRNFVLVVPTSMCASHEAQQIAFTAELLHYSRDRYPNVDGVVAIPHNKGCGCQDGSTLDVMLRTLSNYADHPNVGGVVLIDLGCEKTNLEKVEQYLLARDRSFDKPFAKVGIQEAGGVIEGTETIEEVGARVFEHVRRVAGGEVPALAEEHKHREFQFWAEQTVSL